MKSAVSPLPEHPNTLRGQHNSKRSLIQLEHVGKVYRTGDVEVQALVDITFEVEKGEYLAIVGQSGSGKTTLLDILGCLSRPTTGKYWLGGKCASTLPDVELTTIRNQKVGFVFQTFQLLPRKTAIENVQLPLLYAGQSLKDQRIRAEALLEQVGLQDRLRHYPTQLSGGQQQRVAIARALINQPTILLADEPTGNLDSRTGQEIMSLFQAFHESGQTIIMITHETSLAMIASRRITLRDGRIVMDDFLHEQPQRFMDRSRDL